MQEILVEVQDIHLSFGGLKALNGIDLKVYQGEILGLVGPNGAGKTCLLNIISGVYKPDSGSVIFKGKEITGLSPHKAPEIGIARTFQLVELFKSMNVLDNVLLGCHCQMRGNIFSGGIFWGLGQKEEVRFREKVEEVIKFLELERYRRIPVGGLPFGIQKLVGVARALSMEPRILLLDEPSSGMNRQEKEDLARFLLRIKYELGIAMVWVEHDMKLISDLTDRIAVFQYGRKIAEGSAEEVVNHPDVIQAYLGTTVEVNPQTR
jgi:branched-chain amino acid transport system ATP-binding protein